MKKIVVAMMMVAVWCIPAFADGVIWRVPVDMAGNPAPCLYNGTDGAILDTGARTIDGTVNMSITTGYEASDTQAGVAQFTDSGYMQVSVEGITFSYDQDTHIVGGETIDRDNLIDPDDALYTGAFLHGFDFEQKNWNRICADTSAGGASLFVSLRDDIGGHIGNDDQSPLYVKDGSLTTFYDNAIGAAAEVSDTQPLPVVTAPSTGYAFASVNSGASGVVDLGETAAWSFASITTDTDICWKPQVAGTAVASDTTGKVLDVGMESMIPAFTYRYIEWCVRSFNGGGPLSGTEHVAVEAYKQ